jgi:hypothetical protein
METQAVKPRKSWFGRLAVILFRVSLAVVVLLSAARMSWRFSGSNQWELFRDKKGVKIWTLKQPGADLIRVRGIVQIRSSMAGLVKWIIDDDTCRDIDCYDVKTLENVDNQIKYSMFKFNVPSPFKPREFVVRERVHQIPSTKEVWVELAAAPERIPANDCCVRVTNMSNFWRLTPKGNGIIEVEYTVNMNEGGFVPDLILNRDRPRWIYSELRKLQGYLDHEKYRTAKYAFIAEP